MASPSTGLGSDTSADLAPSHCALTPTASYHHGKEGKNQQLCLLKRANSRVIFLFDTAPVTIISSLVSKVIIK